MSCERRTDGKCDEEVIEGKVGVARVGEDVVVGVEGGEEVEKAEKEKGWDGAEKCHTAHSSFEKLFGGVSTVLAVHE